MYLIQIWYYSPPILEYSILLQNLCFLISFSICYAEKQMCFEIRQINITIDCSKINNLKIRWLQLVIPESHKKKWINGHSLQRRKYNLHTCIMQRRMHGPDNWVRGDLWMVRTKEGWSNIIIKWDNPTLPLMLIIIQFFLGVVAIKLFLFWPYYFSFNRCTGVTTNHGIARCVQDQFKEVIYYVWCWRGRWILQEKRLFLPTCCSCRWFCR